MLYQMLFWLVWFYVCHWLMYNQQLGVLLKRELGYNSAYNGFCDESYMHLFGVGIKDMFDSEERKFSAFLNGCNGEATNLDDLAERNAEAKRRNREAQTNRKRQNPDVNRDGKFRFAVLLTELNSCNRAIAIAKEQVNTYEVGMATVRRNAILQDIRAHYPDRLQEIMQLPEFSIQHVKEEEVVTVMRKIRLYTVATTNKFMSVERLVLINLVIIVIFCILCILFDTIVPFCVMTVICVVFTGHWMYKKHMVIGEGGVTPEFIGNSNTTIINDPTFSLMRIADNTFYKVKGYTHYVDIDVPDFYLEHKGGGVSQVLAGCSTDSQLAAIAYSTLMKDDGVFQKWNTNLPQSHTWYCRYVSMYFAQQHMYHLYQVSLMSGRSGKITLPGWTGSEVNFRFSGRIHGCIRLGIYRQYFETSQSTDSWIDNSRFKVTRWTKNGLTYRSQGITPSTWLSQYGFSETDHVNQKRLRRYRTRILTFHNGGVMYARTNQNLISALNRMFSCRESLELETTLQRLQQLNVRLGNRRLPGLLKSISDTIKRQFDTSCEIDDLIGQLSLIEETHPKKELRKQAFEYIQQLTLIKNVTYATKVTAKVKIEVAKFMKNARVYVDMTTPQSLMGGWLINPLKDAMREVDLGWCLFVFAKTTDEISMQSCFNALRDNEHRPVCVYHSDDAVMQLPCSDGVFRFNLDISACDRSNLRPIFEYLLSFIPEGPWKFLYERMVQGCELPLIVPNPSTNGEYIKAVPCGPFEYSGCNLTTVLNNAALLAIAASIFHGFRRHMTKDEVRNLVPQRAKSVGYVVTINPCHHVEQVQFLKYSPSDPINWYPVRNLGCILRAVGHYDGDLPGRGSLEQRAIQHISQVVTGITSGYIDPLANILRRRFSSNNGKSNKYQWIVNDYCKVVGVSHIIKRYSLEEFEVQLLRDLIEECQIGDYVTSPVLDKIFKVDY